MPYMYILECADSTYYVGSTRNLEHGLEQHAIGAVHVYEHAAASEARVSRSCR